MCCSNSFLFEQTTSKKTRLSSTHQEVESNQTPKSPRHADAPSDEPCSVSCSSTDKETKIHCSVSCFAHVRNDSHVPASALQMKQLHFFQQLPFTEDFSEEVTYIPRDIKQRQGLFMWSIKVR